MQTEYDEKNTEAVNFEFAVAARGFHFSREFRRVGD